MININNKKDCCGCTACYSICPKGCIDMKLDEEGFPYPIVNKDLCINCSLCNQVCPMNKIVKEDDEKVSIFAAVQYKNKSVRIESTAGGAFSLFADYLIDSGAIVYACGYSEMVVCHLRTDNKNKLSELRGSKYVQSTLNDTYKLIKKDLSNDKIVLFVGTPCQVHGLKNIVGDPCNLFTIDLLCLGVSSPGLFEKWVEYLNDKYDATVTNIQFRNKRYGYSTPNVRVYFKERKPIEQRYDTRVHTRLFFDGYNIRPSCYECMFRELPRVSDFTIGDFSDISQFSRDMDDDIGTTRVWIHTEKGKILFDKVHCEAKILLLNKKDTNIIDGEKRKITIPSKRTEFFIDSKSMSYASLISKWTPKKIKDDIIQVLRPLINNLPFRTRLFKIIRNFRNIKFKKNVRKANNDFRSK